MRGFLLWSICGLLWGACALAAGAEATMETVRTEDGIVQVWHRAPATPDDLALPFFTRGIVVDSFVYRVRDRKRRDLLRYARATLTTIAPTGDILEAYRAALGNDAAQQTDKESGDIRLTAGSTEHFRLVTISPREGHTRIMLEHVQRFTVPPRVYTAEEQRVLRVLDEVAAVHRDAVHAAYRMEQRLLTVGEAADARETPELRWSFDFTRPNRLRLTAGQGEIVGLSVTAEGDTMTVTRQLGEPVTTPLPEKITTELIPEMSQDPVAGLLLDDAPLTAGVDYLAILSIKAQAGTRVAEIILTYPDRYTRLFLTIDLRTKYVLRSETEVVVGDRVLRMVRIYSAMRLRAAPPETSPTPSPLPSPSGASAAVNGP